MSDYGYVLFDLDGTLTDSGPGITNSVTYALKRFGISVTDRSELYRFIGPPLLSAFKEFYGFGDTEAENAVKYYREYYSEKGIFENEVYEGIPKLLKNLRVSGIKTALTTSKPEKYARQILEHFGLSEYFIVAVGASMKETRTEKSELIALTLSKLGVIDKSEAVMVGDRKFDILGAKSNGIASSGVLYGYGSREELISADADFLAETPAELLKLLSRKGERL